MTAEYPITLDVIRFLGIAGRIGGFTMAVPALGSEPVPMRVRILLVIAITVALIPIIPATWFTPTEGSPIGIVYLLKLVGAEAALGLIVALMLRLFMEAFAFAGELIGIHMGFAFAQQLDPSLEQTTSMIGKLMTMIFLMVFLAVGGHLVVLRLAAHSFSILPPGGLVLSEGMESGVLQASARLFVLGFKLSLPVFCIIFFIDIGLALMTKFGQEFQVLMLAFPIRIGLGLFILAASVPVIVPWGRLATLDALDEIWSLLIL